MEKRGTNIKDEDLAGTLYKEYLAFRKKIMSIDNMLKKFLLFIGFLNNWFTKNGIGYLVITGGFAVEVLTGQAYRTMDVDLIASNHRVAEILEAFLEKAGEKIARGYILRDEELMFKSIDIVASTYTRRKKPIKILVDDYYVFVDPPEELIVSYLAGWKYWKSTEDRDKAIWIYSILKDKLDKEYLLQRALEEDVGDKLKFLEELFGDH